MYPIHTGSHTRLLCWPPNHVLCATYRIVGSWHGQISHQLISKRWPAFFRGSTRLGRQMAFFRSRSIRAAFRQHQRSTRTKADLSYGLVGGCGIVALSFQWPGQLTPWQTRLKTVSSFRRQRLVCRHSGSFGRARSHSPFR